MTSADLLKAVRELFTSGGGVVAIPKSIITAYVRTSIRNDAVKSLDLAFARQHFVVDCTATRFASTVRVALAFKLEDADLESPVKSMRFRLTDARVGAVGGAAGVASWLIDPLLKWFYGCTLAQVAASMGLREIELQADDARVDRSGSEWVVTSDFTNRPSHPAML